MTKLKTIVLNLIAILMLGLVFSGCVPTYNIEPIYNKKKQELTIDTLKFKNALESYNNSPHHLGEGNFKKKRAKYIMNGNKCTNLTYSSIEAGHRSAIATNIQIQLIEGANKGIVNCNGTSIANLGFFKCTYSNGRNEYFISSSKRSEYPGRYSKSSKIMTDLKCFNTIENHFKKKAVIDKVEVKNYLIGKGVSNDKVSQYIYNNKISKFENKIEEYRTKKEYKALALAIDENGKYKYGWSWNKTSQDRANDLAIKYCNNMTKAKSECKLVAIGNKVILDSLK